jgi:phosphoribosylanthranilate isomerase
MHVKVCGITTLKDAQYAIECGATYLGFIVYRKSPRYCPPKAIRHIISQLNSPCHYVGVFVNECSNTINQIVQTTGLTHVQLHGDESPDSCRQIDCRVIKALRVSSQSDLMCITNYRHAVEAVLLDTFVDGKFGGTGLPFDWTITKHIPTNSPPIFLSGGLTPNVVQRAIDIVKPFGVDVSSGVEHQPGVKDHRKLKQFISVALSHSA